MTSEAINDPPSNFTLQSHHLVQLRHIANTDEFQQEEEAFPSSSNSTSSPPAGPSGAYDWPQLKDAIKIQIRAVLEENFGESIAMDIHPAAKLFTQSGDSTTEQNLTTEAAATTTQDKLFATSGGETATVASSEPSATVGSSHSNGQTPFVSDADQQNFYPTKRPLSVHTFPALTPADRISYTRTLYSMLDDFDLQPPFTIQRLCELLVSPTNHYNSALKWINAVKRCLSVTATRDAFPISPVQAPIGVMGVNGAHDSEDRASGEMSESEMDRMDGLPPSATSAGGAGRSRSSSVASNNSVEPLFSPIPFIVRDENGALTHAGIGDDGQQDGAEQAGIMEPIPDLELGGADRTASANTLPKEIVDKAPTTANATTTASEFQSCQEEQRKEEKEEEAEDVEMAEEGDDDEKMREAEPESKSESTPTGSASDSSGRVAAAVDASTSNTANAPATTHFEPLGVPDGAVDELDNPTHTLNPLTSTTTSTSTISEDTHSSANIYPTHVAEEEKEEDEKVGTKEQYKEHKEEENDKDSTRSSKRRKSVASIHE